MAASTTTRNETGLTRRAGSCMHPPHRATRPRQMRVQPPEDLFPRMLQRDFQKPGRSVAVSDRAMAASSHPLATLAAVDILREGGHAAEAAVAAVALQSVIDPLMTGLGGDCFALVAGSEGEPLALNGSGPAPQALRRGDLVERGLARIPDDSVHAVTVPGAVEAWIRLVERFGRLGLERVLQPAIRAAEDGFCVTPRVAYDWAAYESRVSSHAPAREQYLPGGSAPAVGARFHQPALARTLRRIAAEGRAGFYEGETAADMVRTLREAGGVHTEEDFARFRAFETEPVAAPYKGHELLECPPNGQGIAALMIARILDGFELKPMGEADRIHVLAEATKLGYAMRDAVIGDPARGETLDVRTLLSDRFVETLRARIRMDEAAEPTAWTGPNHRDTVTVSVVDGDRNAVSIINSIFHPFGSGIYAPGAGILFQNRGSGFSVEENHPNVVDGGKLPFHTIIPGLLRKEKRTVMAFGVMGGQYQAAGHAHLLSQMLDVGLDPQAANEAPRSFAFGDTLTIENTVPKAVRADLEARGHRTQVAEAPLGGCQAIWIDHERGVLLGSSDHRKDGMALGF
jgi:gamma-glutamyltranspeptidase / glutathione hydrolase